MKRYFMDKYSLTLTYMIHVLVFFAPHKSMKIGILFQIIHITIILCLAINATVI